jgi:hypothetical protein
VNVPVVVNIPFAGIVPQFGVHDGVALPGGILHNEKDFPCSLSVNTATSYSSPTANVHDGTK